MQSTNSHSKNDAWPKNALMSCIQDYLNSLSFDELLHAATKLGMNITISSELRHQQEEASHAEYQQ
jgi:hypothetical protein